MTDMTRRAPALALLLATVLGALGATTWAAPADAETCSREAFASAVDGAGAALRGFNAEASPKVQARIKELQRLRGWSDADIESRAIDYLHSPRIAELDESANKLLTRIDEIGDVPDGAAADCKRLTELKEAGQQLLGVVRTKSQITLASIDAAIAEARSGTAPAAERKAAVAAEPGRVPQATAAAAKPAAKPEARPPAGAPSPWKTETEAAAPEQSTAVLATPPARPGNPTPPAPTLDATDSPNGYSIDEVRLATRGFFGTVSTNLGSVIEYAFSRFGRPAGYVLGTEGGGAFLAGVRYGKGELYMRDGARLPVYWHGPSVGYDFGAEGSRTLFLVYHIDSPEQLFRAFAGVDGSAYLVGGVGLTVLKGGPVLMAPIRTGLGLRLGANIGYLRFTPKATWNPF
jgi:hypothetical protein